MRSIDAKEQPNTVKLQELLDNLMGGCVNTAKEILLEMAETIHEDCPNIREGSFIPSGDQWIINYAVQKPPGWDGNKRRKRRLELEQKIRTS